MYAIQSNFGVCVCCGRFGYLLGNRVDQDCYFAEREYQDSYPAPMGDGDEYMIMNHYGLV